MPPNPDQSTVGGVVGCMEGIARSVTAMLLTVSVVMVVIVMVVNATVIADDFVG